MENVTQVDLTSLSNEDVLHFFNNLITSGLVVLHGTNPDVPHMQLEPRQANDSSKESGNKKAVYATIDVHAALNHAILNEAYALGKLHSYVCGEESAGLVKMSSSLYQLFTDRDPYILRDGYVYVLDRSLFVSAPDAGGIEFYSEGTQTPLAIYKVSKKLGDALFVIGKGETKDTVRVYTEHEMEDMERRR